MEYYATVFSIEAVHDIRTKLAKRGIKIEKIERTKPTFAKDKFAYKIYTDQYVWDKVEK